MFNIKELTKRTSTRYLSKTNMLKSSNFSMNLTTLEARSYDWWVFVRKVNGKVIFNRVNYSNSTCKHQNKALRVLNYQYDLKLRFTRLSLSDLEPALCNEVRLAKLEISSLIRAIKKPKTRQSTNAERRLKIQELVKHIDLVRSFKSELSEV
jgi:hypothetical protein